MSDETETSLNALQEQAQREIRKVWHENRWFFSVS